MANFNAIFAGCESFMEGDVEINNDVSVPANDGETVASEVEAETTAVEGGDAAGEAEADAVKDEAASMVFDQVLNMYNHVKENGIDRTFLSLYNNNGQLDNMIGYRFPSCESMDVVGSPNSAVSRAFIAAMEEDNIFKRIWEWIKSVFKRIWDFVVKIANWLRGVFGNLDIRLGKLNKFFNSHKVKEWDTIKDTEVKYTPVDTAKKGWALCQAATSNAGRMTELVEKLCRAHVSQFSIKTKSVNDYDGLVGIVNMYGDLGRQTVDGISNIVKAAEHSMTGNGAKSYTGLDEESSAKWVNEYTSKYIEPISKEVGAMHSASGALGTIQWGSVIMRGYTGTIKSSGDVESCVKKQLDVIKKALTGNLSMKQGLDMLSDSYKRALAVANQEAQHGDKAEQAKLTTVKKITTCLSNMTSTVGKISNLQYKICGKALADLGSLSVCYN